MTVSATIVADSISPKGERLTTIEMEFHRFILPEVNTHRVFSRNYQSSRAVPVTTLLQQILNDPAMPVHWGSNKPGMVAGEELQGWRRTLAQFTWRMAAKAAWLAAKTMAKLGVHKQVANRVLEPFMWTKGIITADAKGWETFFKLRCHPAAQPEIQDLAYKIQTAMKKSVPYPLDYGMWHMPYYLQGFWHKDSELDLSTAVKISTSCVAQISYRKLDDSIEKAEKVYGMLHLPSRGIYHKDPPHFSPAEHVALCCEIDDSSSGNFNCSTWYQYRKMLEVGTEFNYIGE